MIIVSLKTIERCVWQDIKLFYQRRKIECIGFTLTKRVMFGCHDIHGISNHQICRYGAIELQEK